MHFAQPNLAPKSENNAQIRPLIRSVIIPHFSVARGNNSIVLHPFPPFAFRASAPRKSGGNGENPLPPTRAHCTFLLYLLGRNDSCYPSLLSEPLARTYNTYLVYVLIKRQVVVLITRTYYTYYRIALVSTFYYYAHMIRFLSNVPRETLSAHFLGDFLSDVLFRGTVASDFLGSSSFQGNVLSSCFFLLSSCILFLAPCFLLPAFCPPE